MSSTTYLLESEWVWDHTNREFATLTLEECDEDAGKLSDLMTGKLSKDRRDFFLRQLKNVFEAQCPSHGSRRMVRLYKMPHGLNVRELRTPGAELMYVNGIIEVICEFDKKGEPVPAQKEVPVSDGLS